MLTSTAISWGRPPFSRREHSAAGAPESAKAALLVSLDRVEEGRGSCPVVAPANDCADLKIGVLIQFLRLDEAAGAGTRRAASRGGRAPLPARRCLRVAAEVGGVILIIYARSERAAAWYASYDAVPLADKPLTLVMALATFEADLKAGGHL